MHLQFTFIFGHRHSVNQTFHFTNRFTPQSTRATVGNGNERGLQPVNVHLQYCKDLFSSLVIFHIEDKTRQYSLNVKNERIINARHRRDVFAICTHTNTATRFSQMDCKFIFTVFILLTVFRIVIYSVVFHELLCTC